MRLLWLDINASYSHTSLALPALHAQITGDEDVVIEVLRITTKKDPLWVIKEILEYNPDVVMSTLWLFNSDYTLKILRKLNALRASLRIILGGPEFLGDNYRFLSEHRYIEAVFRGEGEDAFHILLSGLKEGSSLEEIDGICLINSDGHYKDNGKAKVKSFKSLTPPEHSPFFSWDKPFVQIETSRGCFNRCSFCTSGDCRNIEDVDPGVIEQRVINIRDMGVKNIRILDRTFNASQKRAVELLEVFSHFSKDICFHLEIHPSLLSPEVRDKIATLPAGLLHIETGIQSLDDNVLKACKRRGDATKALNGLRFLTSLKKFTVHADLIAGLPLYTYRKLMEDFKTLVKTGVDEIQIELLKMLPGTNIRKEAEKYGIKYSPVPQYEVLSSNSASTEELYRISLLSKIVDLWYNKVHFRDPFIKLILEYDDFIESFLSYIISADILNNPLGPETRGLLLYNFCSSNYADMTVMLKESWMRSGLSLKKFPGS
jgi:radical SAM superfamily enzyme YgiQ (UPF0313 family)